MKTSAEDLAEAVRKALAEACPVPDFVFLEEGVYVRGVFMTWAEWDAKGADK